MLSPRDQIEMMRRCAAEIKQLRAQVAALKLQAEAYGLMRKIIDVAIKEPPRGYAEDLAWRLEKEARAIEATLKAEGEVPQ